MAVQTPIIEMFDPFDADKEYKIVFDYFGTERIIKNNIVIEDISDGRTVYNREITTFLFNHLLPARTLNNGKSYRIKIRVISDSNEYSDFTPFRIFHTLTEPTFSVDNITEGIIKEQNPLINVKYFQQEHEALHSYQFHLYDHNKVLINSYSVRYYKDMIVHRTPTFYYELKELISGLENSLRYFIRVTTVGVKGQQGDSGYIPFTTSYVSPNAYSSLEGENICKDGSVKLKITGRRVLLKVIDRYGNEVNGNDVNFIDGERIKLSTTSNAGGYKKLTVDKTFRLSDDSFVYQVWIMDLEENITLLVLDSPIGVLKLKYLHDEVNTIGAFHVFKRYYGLNKISRFKSNDIAPPPTGKMFSVWLRCVNGMVDIKAEHVNIDRNLKQRG